MSSLNDAVVMVVAHVRSLDVFDPRIRISSKVGPCRYIPGEEAAVRVAKQEKISFAIEMGVA